VFSFSFFAVVSFLGGRRVWWDAKTIVGLPTKEKRKGAKKGGTPEKKGSSRKKEKGKKSRTKHAGRGKIC
jgi:hypothetical protein